MAEVDLPRWLSQQRDSFWTFVARDGPIQDLIVAHRGICYEGASERLGGFLGRRHSVPSRVVELSFSLDGTEFRVPVPAPDDAGVFEVNGERCYAPVQRLVWDSQSDPPEVEYRRIDHALLDGWRRRMVPRFGGRTRAEEFARLEPEDALALLLGYLRDVLLPSRRDGEMVLQRLEGNCWSALACQTQVRTIAVRRERSADWCVGPARQGRYTGLYTTTAYGVSVRRAPQGLDPFHTPEGEAIGLTRYLAIGACVGDDRQLAIPGGTGLGLLPQCVPFLQHDDPRRVLMASNMMSQAQGVTGSEQPLVMTETEAALRDGMPGAVEDLGTNLRVGFMFWKGLNYEDAIVVSESAAQKLHITEERVVCVPIPAFADLADLSDEDFEDGLRRVGGFVDRGDPLVQLSYGPLRLGLRVPELPEELQRRITPFPSALPWQDHALMSPVAGRIVCASRVPLHTEDADAASHYSMRVDFVLHADRPLAVGDKLCNRHGNKGVVSAFLPDDEMPRVDGQPLEVLFSPIGVVNRGNYGQLLEAIVGGQEGRPAVDPSVTDRTQERASQIVSSLGNGSGLVYSEVTVPGPDGGHSVRAVTGVNYILRLPHHARDRFNVHGEGKYSQVTGQPPPGVGQKYGEMEMWALQAHGAAAILSELCGGRCRRDACEPQGGPLPQRALKDWLSAACLELEVRDGEAIVQTAAGDPRGSEILNTGLPCSKDPACRADAKGDVAPAVVALRRLSSQPFFDEHGPIHLDLGRPVDIPWGDAGSGRYLPILPARRRWSPSGRGVDRLTRLYTEVVRLCCRRRRGGQVDGGDLGRAVGKLLRALRAGLDGKHGAVRRIGLCRRLDYSARLVIVPDPALAVDTVSLPWDAIRTLFRQALLDAGLRQDALDTEQAALRNADVVGLAEAANSALADHWVLLNRNPSLHKYSILSFRPAVHFSDWCLRVPLLVTSPFGADFDSDTMTVVPLFTEAARNEAVGLSVAQNLRSEADGRLTVPLTKELKLGQWLIENDEPLAAALNGELASAGLPTLQRPWQPLEEILCGGTISATDAVAFLRVLVDHCLGALERAGDHFAFGSPECLRAFLRGQVESGAAKDRVGTEDAPLVSGVPLGGLRAMAQERVGMMIDARAAVGMFGGYLRRLYYRIGASAGNGLAFQGLARDGLASAQSITALATQRALSPKGGSMPLAFGAFEKSLEDCLANKGPLSSLPAFEELSSWLDLPPDLLAQHIGSLAAGVNLSHTSLLVFLANPGEALQGGPPFEGPLTDLRIALFMA